MLFNHTYSPGDTDENETSSSVAMTTTTIVTVNQPITIVEEAVKLDEINREIHARKIEIAGMLNFDPDSLVRSYKIIFYIRFHMKKKPACFIMFVHHMFNTINF